MATPEELYWKYSDLLQKKKDYAIAVTTAISLVVFSGSELCQL